MQIDPTTYQQVQRMDAQKANRLRSVQTLPESGDQGDSVMLGEELHMYSDGQWTSVIAGVMARVAALEARVTALEGEDDG